MELSVPTLSVLHICSDFAKQRVYSELVAELDAAQVSQFVYVPVRTSAEKGVNEDPKLKNVRYRYSHLLRPAHRIFFRTKIRKIFRDLMSRLDPNAFSCVHAHFLFSDGAVALRLNEEFGLPYLVAVRNTDINVFMKYRPDLRWVCRKIIRNARRVVFISPAYEERLIERLPDHIARELQRKATVIPNGVSEFWLNGSSRDRANSDSALKLLYVGELSRNKNVTSILRAASLALEKRKLTLTIVGDGGDAESKIDSMIASGKYSFARRLGRVSDRTALSRIYEEHDIFVMPSFLETFGVAYIEALSRGLPIIFSKGQGVDGFFPERAVGAAVDPRNVSEIASAILEIGDALSEMRSTCVTNAQSFSWKVVSSRYLSLYGEICNEQSARD